MWREASVPELMAVAATVVHYLECHNHVICPPLPGVSNGSILGKSNCEFIGLFIFIGDLQYCALLREIINHFNRPIL